MAFNCPLAGATPTNCGNYVVGYVSNLEYVSQNLLSIINTIILPDLAGAGPYDVTDANCDCYPICPTGDPNCLSTSLATVFDCTDWQQIIERLTNESTVGTEAGLLKILSQTLKCTLGTLNNGNFGFAAQIERFLCLVDSLIIRLDSVSCNSNCPEIVGDLLCLIIEILTNLISAIAKATTLIYYYNCATSTDISTRNKVISTFFECMACDFINDLCELERLISELSAIVVGFATCDIQRCTPCFTASSAPRKVRNICCPSNIQQSKCGCSVPMLSPYQSSSGCACKK